MILIVIPVLLVCVAAGLWIYARWNYGVLEKMGIPVVKYTNPILGSTRELYETVGGENDIKWMKEYGPIFGVYEGRTPQVFICVPELVRLICVKDVDHFGGRRDFDFGDPLMNEMPDFMAPEKWKVVRSMTSPAFSTAKIKLMSLPMQEATQDFISDLKEKIGKSENGRIERFAIDTEVHSMLTDLVGRCVFSVNFKDGKTEFAQLVKQFLTTPSNSMFQNQELTLYTHAFPFIKKFLPSPFYNKELARKFIRSFKELLNERRMSGVKRNDVVNLCLEWYEKLDSPEYKKVGITEETLIVQALTFFFASQDQISTMVAAVIFHMAKDPALEKRILQEVDKTYSKHNGKICHEHLPELPLLHSCIQECLRLYTVFHRTERMCTKDWRNEEYNLDFKKGTVIMFPIWALNRNPEYTENAEEFEADRFMPENKDKLNVYATTSFGHGPRICPGKRFAMEAIPLVLVNLLKELKFIAREDSQITFWPGGPMFNPHDEIVFDVMNRFG